MVQAILTSQSQKSLSSQDIESIGSQGSMSAPTLEWDSNEQSSGEEIEVEKTKVWGKLFPVGKHFEYLGVTDLIQESYSVGRADDCTITLQGDDDPNFLLYSKKHFEIRREKLSTGEHVFLLDCSSNGTLVNGVKVGKNNKQALNNNDEICLTIKKQLAFIYMASDSNEDAQFPKELRTKYTISKVLGRGACGEVRLAFEKGSCNKVAIKIIKKRNFSQNTKMMSKEQTLNEVRILKALKHPFIISIEDVVDTDDGLFIVLELMEGGELFDRVVSVGQLEEKVAKFYFYQIVLAIKYLHDQGITHRDLKPENILLLSDKEDTVVKVTDFGLSKFVDSKTLMTTFCGTPNYLAPEVLITNGMGSYTNAIDCWSLGVILFIMLVGYPPFSDERTDMELSKQIKEGNVDYPKKYWNGISKNAIDLCRKLLTVDIKKRYSMEQCLTHPWLQDDNIKAKTRNISGGLMLPPSSLPKKRKGEIETLDIPAKK
ncbi:DgyrCDS4314 [Dimorphilus gyrociliatus]|uniref:DgyrCDS4314 n=1 Tax=Dimorphilus gyrociliatus TaxID=2664684 RepID=A0A7I8VG56_9ANNE|nr:DgyrCDS4314 [Dimorphilus gyrociliatus]